MTKKEIVLLASTTLVVTSFLALFMLRSMLQPANARSNSSTQLRTTTTAVVPALTLPPAPVPLVPIPDTGGQISLKSMSREEATKIYVQRFNADHQYDWKVPLDFYGKVIDETNQPVAGATAHLEWNTIGVPGGTASEQTLSDGQGLFSLTGQHGKVLEVRVGKNGYYTVDGGAGAVAFEYANPSSPNYIEAENGNPIIFHLRRQGNGVKLFVKTLDVPIPKDQPLKQINLLQGFIKPDGALTISSDKSKSLPGAQPFPWTVTLSLSEGGMVETTDQFPFEAPLNGYTSTAAIDMTNIDPAIWRGSVAKTYYFYLPSSNTYGRLTVSTSATLPTVTLNIAYNPIAGNRVLEPASK